MSAVPAAAISRATADTQSTDYILSSGCRRQSACGIDREDSFRIPSKGKTLRAIMGDKTRPKEPSLLWIPVRVPGLFARQPLGIRDKKESSRA
jgi:hypothetical protein